MTYLSIMNSPLLYGLVIVGLLAVSIYCVWMVRKGMKRCVELGIEKHELNNLIKGTITFSAVPSGGGPLHSLHCLGCALVLVSPFRAGRRRL